MILGLGTGFAYPKVAGGTPVVPDTPLNTAPSTVERAMFSDQFVFNGSNQLTGFTNDIFGNAHNSALLGAPAKGENGGYVMSEATANTNYVQTTLSELNVTFPSTRTVHMVYKKRLASDNAGVLIGGNTDTKYLGAFENGVTGSQSLESISRTQNYRARGSTKSPSPTRDQLHDLVYSDTDVIAVAMIGAIIADGICRWGRYRPVATTYHMEIEVLGWAVSGSKVLADVDEVNTWLERWAIPA